MRYTANLSVVVLLMLLVGLSGCFSSNPEDIEAFLRPAEKDVTSDDYIMMPPDRVTVISSKVPEFKGTTQSIGHTQTIRPDGNISFETIGEIHAAGKTPRQIAEILARKMSALYNFDNENPIDVRVSNQSKWYYIIGMVQHPGAQLYTGRETTLSAISKAVPNVQAWEEKTQVIRPSTDPTGDPKIFNLNFKRMIEHGDMSGNVLLQEGDVIYVPPTILGTIGLTVQEIVGPLTGGIGVVSDAQNLD